MKGIPGRVTKALPSQAKLECADNTGAKIVELIAVLNKDLKSSFLAVSYTHLTLPTIYSV